MHESDDLDYRCGKFNVGDKGQRYEVLYKDRSGIEKVFGWTDREDGEPLMGSIKLNPSMTSPRVVDRRRPTIQELIRDSDLRIKRKESMLKESVTVEDAIALLNEAVLLDRAAMSELFLRKRVACSDAFADHPTIQVGSEKGQGNVGVLGIINGLFGVDEHRYGAIAMIVDFDDGQGPNSISKFGQINRFERTPPRRAGEGKPE